MQEKSLPFTYPLSLHTEGGYCGPTCPFHVNHECTIFSASLYYRGEDKTRIYRCDACIKYTESLQLMSNRAHFEVKK